MAIAKVTCVARHNNYVGFNNIKLQIPADQHRCYYVKAKVTALRPIRVANSQSYMSYEKNINHKDILIKLITHASRLTNKNYLHLFWDR